MTISLCLITKNEGNSLEEFLNHHKELADEIIIVDTGSTDSTLDIAKRFTNKVFFFEWNDDFSSARNFSISEATKEWILWLDPDERIRKEDFEEIKELTENKAFLGFRFIQETYYNSKQIMIRGICKLFQNNEKIRFIYPVHETVRESIKQLSGRIGKTGIVIRHEPKLGKEKSEYYLKLLEKKKKDFPDSNTDKEIETEKSICGKDL